MLLRVISESSDCPLEASLYDADSGKSHTGSAASLAFHWTDIAQTDGVVGFRHLGRHITRTLIGQAPTLLIGRELQSVAVPALLCHKEPARRIQSTLLGGYFACFSLVLYGIRIGSWLP